VGANFPEWLLFSMGRCAVAETRSPKSEIRKKAEVRNPNILARIFHTLKGLTQWTLRESSVRRAMFIATFRTARHSRNGTRTTDRKIEDRKMKCNPIFLSLIFLSWCLSSAPLPEVPPQPANNFDYCSAEKREKKGGACLSPFSEL
jgi:hypothetical protein